MKHIFFTWMCILFSIVVKAQNAGDIDPTFQIGKSFSKSGSINVITTQSDGKIIVGGTFNSYDKISANDIIRLNTDGTIDSTFTSATEPFTFVLTVTLQPDGKILVGDLGSIFRLNSNGTLDSTFTPGPAIIFPTAISLQSDGKIIVGE